MGRKYWLKDKKRADFLPSPFLPSPFNRRHLFLLLGPEKGEQKQEEQKQRHPSQRIDRSVSSIFEIFHVDQNQSQ